MNENEFNNIKKYLTKSHVYSNNFKRVISNTFNETLSDLDDAEHVDKRHINLCNAKINAKFLFFFINADIDINTAKQEVVNKLDTTVEPNGHFVLSNNEDGTWNNITKQYLYNMLYEYVLFLSREEYNAIVALIESNNIDYNKQDLKSQENIYWIVYMINSDALFNYTTQMTNEYKQLSFIQKIKAGL